VLTWPTQAPNPSLAGDELAVAGVITVATKATRITVRQSPIATIGCAT
jgi:hypothetical protein